MFGDVIYVDAKTLAQKLLFLENFGVALNTDTLLVSDINIWNFDTMYSWIKCLEMLYLLMT